MNVEQFELFKQYELFERYQAMLDEFIKNNPHILEESLSNLAYCNDIPYGNRNIYYEFDYMPYINMRYVDKGYMFERYKLRVDKMI